MTEPISMSMERQKRGRDFQGHGSSRGRGTESADTEAPQQLLLAIYPETNPTDQLMEQVCEIGNLEKACRKVKANKGVPGVDGMAAKELDKWLQAHGEELRQALLQGRYLPQPVRGVQIPKPGGGVRQLGIPTVVDRLIQQAIHQVLDRILDPTFSKSSYGFRPRRNAHQAIMRASEYVQDGRTIVVDIDLEKFFDRVNHDTLMGRLAKRISDKRLLKLIRRYLQAGIMQDGVCVAREEGTPQGGPLSPLLANFLLDELDRELERRGHCFCRYADDCNIYVKTVTAGTRVMESVVEFLETRLKLKVNRQKSAVAPVSERKFLGYRIQDNGGLTIAPQSMEKVKEKIREKTRRKTPGPLEGTIKKLNTQLIGWVYYFKLTRGRIQLESLDGWIRRRLRAIKLAQLRKPRTIAEFLEGQGIAKDTSKRIATSGKGIWRLAKTTGVHKAMRNKWLESLGLVSLREKWEKLAGNLKETAVYGTVRTVV